MNNFLRREGFGFRLKDRQTTDNSTTELFDVSGEVTIILPTETGDYQVIRMEGWEFERQFEQNLYAQFDHSNFYTPDLQSTIVPEVINKASFTLRPVPGSTVEFETIERVIACTFCDDADDDCEHCYGTGEIEQNTVEV